MMGDDRNLPSEGRRGCVMVLSNGNRRPADVAKSVWERRGRNEERRGLDLRQTSDTLLQRVMSRSEVSSTIDGLQWQREAVLHAKQASVIDVVELGARERPR